MATSFLQPSFASGELAPSLWARVDVARYQNGLRLCRNFFVMPYGGVRNRAGTVFIQSTKGDGRARLIPFQFNDQQTYVLEFGHLYMRVYKAGGVVLAGGGGVYEIATPYTEAQLFEVNFTQSADVLTLVHPHHEPRKLSRLAHDNWTLAVYAFVPGIAAPASATATGVAGTGNAYSWRYQVTAVVDQNGVIDESLPVTSNATTTHADKMRATVSWPAVAGATYYNVYKDTSGGGVYGFVGRATGLSFDDVNITAAKTDTPPNAFNPFVGSGNYPGAVTYYQQRLCFAGSDKSPQTVWMSRVGNFNNFGYATPYKDDDSITFSVASREVHRFRHLLPLRDLLGLTTDGEWVISGGTTGMTAKNVLAEIQSYNGASKIQPIVVDSSALYVQARGAKVSALQYSFEADGFAGNDLTKYSPHFFRGYELVDWAFQQQPDSLVWAVRNDGVMLGMTYLPEEQLVAWHQHVTDGAVESVASIPEGDEDALYLIVRRTINGVTRRYVERMASRRTVDMEDAFFVDCGLTYDGRNTVDSKTLQLLGGTTWKHPETLTLQAAGHAPFTAGSVGRRYRLRLGADLVRVDVLTYTDADTVTVRLVEACPVSLQGVATSDWALMAASLSGLGHLEGKTVSILTDGDVHPQTTVSAGALTLQYPAAVVHVGLPYVAEMQTLDIDVQGGETLLDKRKTIPSVTAYLEESRNFMAGAGPDSRLYEQRATSRERYTDAIPTDTGPSTLSIASQWSEAGRVYIRQADPLPLTILALIPEVSIAGRG